MEQFEVGQRWISEMEPELGLGRLIQVENRKVRISFSASKCERLYAIESAPLKRVRFRIGDEIKHQNGNNFTVTDVEETDQLVVYHCDKFSFPEAELSDSISFTTPKDRILSGIVDNSTAFNLRYETLMLRQKISESKARGFIGGRIDLIPHQFYIADQIVSRHIPRVLLADEVGLGKTIEACLIIHQLLLSNRIGRVLILVPESLVHQWFVELLRRFNLLFRIFDEDYCISIETANPDLNPFLEDQLGICDIHFLTNSEKRNQQAIEAEWDILVVDEAHNLAEQSSAYKIVKKLGSQTPGLMLLTGTPEQLGHRGHFDRLRLLDPPRYHNYDLFLKEIKNYQKIAGIIDKLSGKARLSDNEIKNLKKIDKRKFLDNSQKSVDKINSDPKIREQIINNLLDQHGVGRVMFRNTRATITGFPKRIFFPELLEGTRANLDHVNKEFICDLNKDKIDFNYLADDPRTVWLAGFLRKLKGKKVLLICRSKQKAGFLHSALQKRIKIKAGLFHEDMSLVQRDRNAAWFAEKDGAQVLICSEIGSEGRNFQFSHHLVLFDLPADPDLLEQRIGRLDRIGQTKTIHIYVPFISGSALEVLVRWYHEGLNSFEKNVPGAYEIYQKFQNQIFETISQNEKENQIDQNKLDRLIQQTGLFRKKLAVRLEKGRDRLLDLNSYQPQKAEGLINLVKKLDRDRTLEKFMLKIFDFFGVLFEDLEERCYQINFELLKNNYFPVPVLREEGLIVSFDRKRAKSREDYEFLTWDHPMVSGAMDLILGSEQGNSCFVIWPDQNTPAIYLEVIYVLECVAPLSLHADRFLPPAPVRIAVDHLLEDCSTQITSEQIRKNVTDGQPENLFENKQFTRELFPEMVKKSEKLAELRKSEIIREALKKMKNTLQNEVTRLTNLKKINPGIRPEEIKLCQQELLALQNHISSARLRLDALRLIWRGN